jgi:hypothetical protein
MKELMEEINYLLDTTRWSCADIADYCSCPVSYVNEIVEARWKKRIS